MYPESRLVRVVKNVLWGVVVAGLAAVVGAIVAGFASLPAMLIAWVVTDAFGWGNANQASIVAWTCGLCFALGALAVLGAVFRQDYSFAQGRLD